MAPSDPSSTSAPLLPRRRRARCRRGGRRRTLLLAVVAAATLGAGCGGGEAADGTDGPSTSAASQFGSSMGVQRATPSQVAELGSGPADGETWSVPVGWNICGQFLEPLAPVASSEVGPFEVTPSGRVEVSAAAEVPTVGDLAEVVGVELAPGRLTMPESTTPSVLESTVPPTRVAGATFSNGDTCGDTTATVQVWVYPQEAATSGDGILVVAADPQDVPFVEDGMAVVVAFAPESSLPTLPPAALVDP